MKKIANFLIIEQKNEIFTIYLTAELQDDLGTIGFLKFTNKKQLEKDDVVAKIEASKTVFSIKTPLKCRIIELNQLAEKDPKILNSHDSEKNWLFKAKDIDQSEFDELEDF
ncbi:glycine cleavage system protein H [Mesomycoplasma hyopneumoniae]|uniref:Glycine cleavage system H protein n=1 Tax=Mesomycoplasma hyopneumoniae (strain 7448) TaxID=262722 RepID=Q4A854_MESH7|nr:glycine cleavage system protein H [Mesomycoplasma hyopneumoniae]AAZ53685.1 glycine cleavage system H protein [Mesomycoplasma hyopneumoniae 7448]NYN92270.1 glycine cleavage system protein H [Mesomycoplasma hyopneumoniae]